MLGNARIFAPDLEMCFPWQSPTDPALSIEAKKMILICETISRKEVLHKFRFLAVSAASRRRDSKLLNELIPSTEEPFGRTFLTGEGAVLIRRTTHRTPEQVSMMAEKA